MTLRRAVAAGLALVASMLAVPAAAQLVYIGTQATEPGQGIVAARFDARSGRLTPIGVVAEARRPIWLLMHPNRPILYSVAETGSEGAYRGTVLSFVPDRKTGQLRRIGSTASGGAGPTHLDLDLRSGTLFVAHYGSGQVSVLPLLGDGTLGAPVSVQQHRGSGPSTRQQGPHAHAVMLDPWRRFLLSPDLGADRLFRYRFDPATRSLTPADPVAVAPGSGPRHIAFHPRGRFLYLFNELKPELRVYAWEPRTGAPTFVQSVPAVSDPAGYPQASGAEVMVSRDGRFLYASVRVEDALVAYAIDRRSGKLTEIQRIASDGQRPWAFQVDPSGRWMLVANQASNAIAVFRRDPRTGLLAATGNSIEVAKPVAITFLR